MSDANRANNVPSSRMKALYGYFSDLWGEPEYLLWFNPMKAAFPAKLAKLHVGVWPTKNENGVNTFLTFGMSEQVMAQNCVARRVELHLAVRGSLSEKQINEGARFLANLSQYPFDHNLCLDWWHRLRDVGPIPFFPERRKLLCRPPFVQKASGEVEYNEETIRFLYIVPLTEEEDRILAEEGSAAYEKYLADLGLDPLGHRE